MKVNVRSFFKVKNDRIIKILCLAVFCVLAFSLSPLSSAQATEYVDTNATPGGNGSSWAEAHTNIQDAIDAAVADEEIWVRQGTYTLTTQIDVDVAVHIYGGFPTGGNPGWGERDWETFVTTVNGNDAAYHCFFVTVDATIDGFTITGGRAYGTTGIDYRGGGVFINACSATIANCTIESNEAFTLGGGMFIINSPSTTITNCIISGNTAEDDGGGIYMWTPSDIMITRCSFLENSAANGGAIYDDTSVSTIITNCTFSDNFVNTGGDGGGIYNDNSDSIITNCIFSGQTADRYGGAIRNDGSDPDITNCTFTNNHANDGGGAIQNYASNPTITNCILWGDTATSQGNEIYTFSGTPVVSYSNIDQGGYAGSNGNISQDPDFAGTLDYHIAAGSPCIDAGDNTALPFDLADLDDDGDIDEEIPYDLDDNPRRSGVDTVPIVDMGAYEYLTHLITVTPGDNGDIAPGTGDVNHGSEPIYTITPDTGYHIVDVTVDGVSVGAVGSYQFAPVTAPHEIAASFAIDTYTITVTPGDNGDITPGTGDVNHGSEPIYTITPDTGYHIVDVTVDGVSVGAVGSYQFAPVTAPHEIAASFAIDTYTITVTPGDNGDITPGTGDVNHGSEPIYTITPDTGYHIVDVTVDGVSVGAVGSYQFAPVTAPHEIAASFAIDTYTITVTPGDNGDITPGTGDVNHGSEPIYTITPDEYHHIVDVTVDGVSQGAISSYQFAPVTAPHEIAASFAIDTYTVTFVPGTNGSITGDLIQEDVPYGGSCTEVTAVPDTNYHLVDWTDPGGFTSTENPLTVNNVLSDMTITANFAIDTYPVGDELAVNFGADGLYHYDGSDWTSLASWSPDGDMVEWTGGLAVDFGSYGLWNYDGTTWTSLTSWNPDGNMLEWTGGLAVDFGSYGLWNYDGTSWTSLAGWNPDGNMVEWTGGLAVDFGSYGLWNYDGTSWTSLASWNPDGNMVEWTGGLAVDFGSYGLWNYDGTTWTSLASWEPDGNMMKWTGGLAVDFGSYGLWNYDGTTWTSLAGWNPDGMEVYDTGLAVDFDANGLWYYDGSTWTNLAGWNPDGNMVEWTGGLAVDFGVSYGLWNYDGTSWTSLAGWNPEDMTDVDLY